MNHYEKIHSLCATCGATFSQVTGLTFIAENCYECCKHATSNAAAKECTELMDDLDALVAAGWEELYSP